MRLLVFLLTSGLSQNIVRYELLYKRLVVDHVPRDPLCYICDDNKHEVYHRKCTLELLSFSHPKDADTKENNGQDDQNSRLKKVTTDETHQYQCAKNKYFHKQPSRGNCKA